MVPAVVASTSSHGHANGFSNGVHRSPTPGVGEGAGAGRGRFGDGASSPVGGPLVLATAGGAPGASGSGGYVASPARSPAAASPPPNSTTSSLHGLLNKASISSLASSSAASTYPSPTSQYHTASAATPPPHPPLHQHHQHSASLASNSTGGSSSWIRSSTSTNGGHYPSSSSHHLPRQPHPHYYPPLHVSSSSSAGSHPHARSASTSDSLASGLTTPASTRSSLSPSAGRKLSPPATSFSPIPRQFLPPLEPRHYTILKEVGDGSFGTVWLADWHSELQLPPGTLPPGPSSRPEYKGKRLVAIKRMKKAFEGGWDECVKLKELKSLQSIAMHPNIIPLYDAFLLPSSKELYFVFECMEGNLYQLTKSRKGRPLASGLTASIFEQILAGLDHIHRSGFFHRDMKPENLLITTTGLADYPASSLYALPSTPAEKDVVVTVKLADFGLARETASRPPYTEYVSTRWYRAPEVLLRSRDYSNPVDMWALGTILLEVLTLKPIFPGDSEIDQVFKICEILGDPSTDYGVDDKGRTRGGGSWPRGVKMAKDVGFAFPKIPPRTFSSLFDTNVVPPQLIDCIADLLRYEPRARLTTQQCLDHAYFREVTYRYAPYRAPGSSVYPASPANSHNAYAAPSLHGLTISTSSAVSTPSSIPSPRVLPPAHGNGTPSYFKPPFMTGVDANGRPLPPADHYLNGGGSSGNGEPVQVQRHYSDGSSGVSGMTNFPIQLVRSGAPDGSSFDQAMSTFPDSVSDQQSANFPSPSQASVWSGNGTADPEWGLHAQSAHAQSSASSAHLQPHTTFRPSAIRPGLAQRRPSFSGSVAASTFYDGSIFEGVAQSRASSIMSFPVSYGNFDNSPSPTFPDSPSSAQTGDSTEGRLQQQQQQSRTTNVGLGFGGSAAPQQAQQQQRASPLVGSSAQSVKSGRWNFGKVFSSDHHAQQPQQPYASDAPAHSLKRTPSVASSLNSGAPMEGVVTSPAPPDAKKEKKLAEKAAREAEKAKREVAMAASRDRARAVMQKKNQLREAADPLHNFSNQPRLVAPVVTKGKGRASDALSQHSNASQASFLSKMPQIVEDTSRLHVSGDGRYKARRRDDDDDVHSVSSNETGHSSYRGRAYSISGVSVSSVATSASDPERRMRHEQLAELGLTRVPSLSSLNSAISAPARHTYAPSHYARTGTGHSSLESSLVRQMNGLATTNRPERSESRGARASSPRDVHAAHHERYSPYPFPGATSTSSASLPRQQQQPPHLPPISSFDQQSTVASSAASISSFHSAPMFQNSQLNPTRPSPPPN